MQGLPEFAIHWATELGASPSRLEELRGGINNRVYLCSAAHQQWVIKGYPATEQGQRDRMKAEVQFLRLANEVAPHLTPKLVYTDSDHRCVVLEYIKGETFEEGIPPHKDEIATAVRFVQLLNQDSQLAREFIEMDASEGFLSLREHIANVNQRIEAMSCDHISSLEKPMAITLMNQLDVELEQVQVKTNRLIDSGAISDILDSSMRCVSPSDFGFHNAVLTSEGVRFIDFEFAGWDDPAKMTIDFMLQPRVPVWGQGSLLSEAWDSDVEHSIKSRCQNLGPILRLKWACIILSVLCPARLNRLLDIIGEEEEASLVRRQLIRANNYLAATSSIQFT